MKNMRFCFIFLSIACSFFNAKAQQVVASSGNHAANDKMQISWTLGEPVTETLSDENSILTQGFHQSRIIVSAVDEILKLDLNITAYPNPTSDNLKLEFKNVQIEDLYYTIYSMDGRMMAKEHVESGIVDIPLSGYTSATYFLKISDSHDILKTFKIIKK